MRRQLGSRRMAGSKYLGCLGREAHSVSHVKAYWVFTNHKPRTMRLFKASEPGDAASRSLFTEVKRSSGSDVGLMSRFNTTFSFPG